MEDRAGAATIIVASVMLWWLCRYHEASLPAAAPWEFSFSWFYATAFPLWWYIRGVMLARPYDRPRWWRHTLFLLGVGAIYFVLQTHFEYLAEHMFFLNRLQHVVMHHFGPFLIALAWPWPTIMRGMPQPLRAIAEGRASVLFFRLMRQPLLAAFLFVGLVIFWLVPAIHFRAMIDPHLYLVMNWTMVGDGLLFWSLVLDPRPPGEAHVSYGMRAALAVGVIFPQILLGAVITLSHTDFYGFYGWCGRIYPTIGPLEDQAFGGMIIWMPQAMMGLAALLLVLNAMRVREEAEAVLGESGAVSASRWTGR
jgi:putative membrane protein